MLPALLAAALLHAAGAGAFRGLILGEALGAVRAYVFPTLEGMRVWSAAYRAWLMQQALVVLGLAHVQWLLLVMTVANLTAEQRAVTTLLLWPVLLPGLALWTRSLAGPGAADRVLLRRDPAQPRHARPGARRAAGGGRLPGRPVAALPSGQLPGIRGAAGRGGGGGGRAGGCWSLPLASGGVPAGRAGAGGGGVGRFI